MSFREHIYGLTHVKHVTHRGELQICCPFCSDSDYHGNVNCDKNVYHCYKCKAGMSALNFLIDGYNIPFQDAKRIIYGGTDRLDRYKAQERDTELERLTQELRGGSHPEEPKTYDVQMPESHPLVATSDSRVMSLATSYLYERLGREQMAEYYDRLEFRVCTRGDYSGRIILPVWDTDGIEGGNLLYFQARAFMPPSRKPTYMNPMVERPLFLPSPLGDRQPIVFCEGYFDALAIGKGAAAVFGSSLTPRQIEQVKRMRPHRAVVCFDPDLAGRQGTIKVCEQLKFLVHFVEVVPRCFLQNVFRTWGTRENGKSESAFRNRFCFLFVACSAGQT